MMTTADILTLTKNNLEIRNTIQDTYLQHLIGSSISAIKDEGVEFTTGGDYTDDEADLIVMYAAYKYRQRVGNGEYTTAALNPQGMPYMLRYALNQKIFSQKMRTQE